MTLKESKTYEKNPTSLSHCLRYFSLDLLKDSEFHPLTPHIHKELGGFPVRQSYPSKTNFHRQIPPRLFSAGIHS